MVESEGFQEAWRIGASQWRKYNDQEKANFWPVREAWKTYKPVGLVAATEAIDFPKENEISADYGELLNRFITQEIRFRVLELEEEIRSSSGRQKQRHSNSLGVLYARNGLYDDAIKVLKPFVDGSGAFPAAQLNIANLYYLTGELSLAARYYRSAADALSNPASAHLGLAMVENKLGNIDAASSAYREFTKHAPHMAERYAYLSGNNSEMARASQAAAGERILWEIEE